MYLYIFATFPKKHEWVVLSYNRNRGRGSASFLHSYINMSFCGVTPCATDCFW